MVKKKILFLVPSVAIGGAERVLVNLLKKIDYSRYDISLFLWFKGGQYLNEIPNQIMLYSATKNEFIARLLIYIKREFHFTLPSKILTRLKIRDYFDVGISFSDGQMTDVLLFVKNHFNKKVAWVHSCIKSQKDLSKYYTPMYVKKITKARYDLLDEIVFVSENSKLEFEEIFKTTAELDIIHNIFDYEAIIKKSNSELPIVYEKDKINIVAIGRLVEVKEYSKLIQVANILAQKELNFKIRIIGDGKLRNKLKSEVISLNVEKYVDFIGSIQNPYPHLKYSDILVLTSSSEAFPTVLIEAMVLKVPIVATSCSGVNEITENGKYGLLTNHTIEDISEKLERMIRNNELRAYYSKLSQKRIKFYDENISLDKIYNVLR